MGCCCGTCPVAGKHGVGVDNPMQKFMTEGVQREKVVVFLPRYPFLAVLGDTVVSDVVQLELAAGCVLTAGGAGDRAAGVLVVGEPPVSAGEPLR